ncbi:hypothetical protein D1BOALGB6SA_8949 [Olavius sp. associated proteobacterium Delta 1]|nr:hypothetical protein D1BOALGB6SA_8949 [Olavius sp. associated proteobacterium Delta 1]
MLLFFFVLTPEHRHLKPDIDESGNIDNKLPL